MHELAILGGGPAGMTAALYAARKNMNTLLLTHDIGGQMLLTSDIENWIGLQQVSGFELTERFRRHMEQFEGIERRLSENATGIECVDNTFIVTSSAGKSYEARSVIIATGKKSRALGVPGEKELSNRGVSYCATCDAPIFAGRDVAVVGGGNSAIQAVIDLLPIAPKIVVINTNPSWQADPILIERIDRSDKVTAYLGWEVTGILGEKRVSGVTIKNNTTGETKDISVQGVFVEIGLTPNSDFAADVVQRNKNNEIIVDCFCRTSVPGLFAAGDVTTVPAKQIVVAAGEGAKAALSAYDFLVMNGYWTGLELNTY